MYASSAAAKPNPKAAAAVLLLVHGYILYLWVFYQNSDICSMAHSVVPGGTGSTICAACYDDQLGQCETKNQIFDENRKPFSS